jgi:hypothetical protein
MIERSAALGWERRFGSNVVSKYENPVVEMIQFFNFVFLLTF